ncbi:GNAT family N-acetyltransferase [Kitasatospora sp. NPDC054939]
MLHTERVTLRARHEDDVPILHAGLYEDVATRSRADTRPWQPLPVARSPYADTDAADAAFFSVLDRATGELAGEALLWGIDPHNRSAHLGLALLPAFRGRGLAVEVVTALCRYGFEVRGLHRLGLETLADNHPMLAAAEAAGFTREGVLRRNAWVCGSFVDEVVLGLLVEEWQERRT